MKRIVFPNKQLRNEFFRELKKSGQGKSWKKISEFIDTTRSMLSNYRGGKILLPEDRFFKLSSLLNKEKQNYFLQNISKKEGNWGQIIGGVKAYEINKKYFEEGRKKGSRAMESFGIKYDFDINMVLSEKLCEFLGVIIGDGCTNKYNRLYQTQISGDKELDRDYYIDTIIPICIELFGIHPKIITRPKGMYINLYSKRLFQLLTERFEIPKGFKSHTVQIPREILNSQDKFIKATLKGMFNTDGGVGVDKRKVYKEPYIRVNYVSASQNLINQISKLLDKFYICHTRHTRLNGKGNAGVIQINGKKNVKSFLKGVGFSNPRHLNKVSLI
ncbi:hypothetical protein CMI47_04300 [Candidatus Pacearchaeota archaeon]|nr:hypothetical protein [Candidatus Pacearchaeota archaeon]|tara:strand:- start:44 stop:1033 length:990 start_codon:yes stop_codon:yes gene_type:complete